jgi:multiple sugar transport system ATP-binding protein
VATEVIRFRAVGSVRESIRVGEIVLESVTKEFGAGVVAVDDVSLTIADGEFMVLVGPSGCGKTTLLRAIGGLEDVTAGRILIDDRDVTDVAPASRDLAMVFQNYALYPHMTVRQNLGYPLRVRRRPRGEIAGRVQEVARLLRLEDLLDRRPGALSGGQQQRVAMGRAIIREPAAFLMDEPLSNLDAKLRVGMRMSLQQLHSRLGTTTVYVTHDQVEAMTLGQRVAVMRDGRVQQADVPQRLYEQPANLFVAAFIGSPSMNLAEVTVDDGAISLGDARIPLDRARRPEARDVVLEQLGSDAFVLFARDAKRVVVEEASPIGDDDATLLDTGEHSLFGARVDPRTAARIGERIRLAVDPSRFHFFTPETGESLLSGADTPARA